MKRMLSAVALVFVMSGAAWAQFAPSTENLRGLKGVRLIVMFGRPDALNEAQRPELLKMVEADATAKLQEAGIPLSRSRFVDEIGRAGDPRLVLTVPMDEPNSARSLTTDVKLFQKVRLSRDPSIETDAVTWSLQGSVGGPGLRDSRIRRQIAGLVERFIEDYRSVNPKETAQSRAKLKDQKR